MFHVSNLNVSVLDPPTHSRQFDVNCGRFDMWVTPKNKRLGLIFAKWLNFKTFGKINSAKMSMFEGNVFNKINYLSKLYF